MGLEETNNSMSKQAPPPSAKVSRWPVHARWALTLLTCFAVGFAWLSEGRDTESDGVEDSQKLTIEGMQPLEVSPGGTLAIRFSGDDPDGAPVTASIDKQPVETIKQGSSTVVVRVPADGAEGRAKVRIHQGDERSKKRDVWLRPLDPSSVILLGLGGIALFVLGLRTLAKGIRTYAGNRMRGALQRVTRGVWRSVAVGAFAGAATQSSVTSAGVLAGLLSSNLLTITTALAIVLGAQLGSAAMALALPLGTKLSVPLVTLGVIWVSLADSRRSRALAKVLLGLGMLFLGFETLRSGFQPLVSAPELVELFSGSASDGIAHALVSSAAGALMTALLQGPGPAFVLVLGLTESTDTIGLHQSLTILAGVPLGVAIATSVVAWPFGGAVRRLAKGHLLVGGLSTILLVASVSFWVAVADKIVPGDPSALGDAHTVLLPGLAVHLVVGFLLSQLCLVCAIVLLLPRLGQWLEGSRHKQRSEGMRTSSSHSAEKLVSGLSNCRDAIGSVRQMWMSGDRAKAADCEHALDLARAQFLDALTAARAESTEQGNNRFSCTLALLKAQDNLLTLQRLVERGVEWGVTPQQAESSSLDALHALVVEGLESLISAVQDPSIGDVNRAREREIWTNAEDNKARAALEKARKDLRLRYVQHWSAVCAAYEEVGNQLFRAADALLGEDDDD